MPFDAILQQYGYVPANHEKPHWFDVSVQNIFDAQGRAIPGYRRVQNDETGDTLHVCSEKYGLIPYQKQFDAFDRELGRSALNLADMHVHTDMTHNGARCFRQYVLPAYVLDMPNKRDLALRFIMFGSYDGSSSFHGRCGAYDFVCANTSVWGTDIANRRVRHVGNDGDLEERISRTIAGLVDAAEHYVANMQRLKDWPGIHVSPQEAGLLFKRLPQATEPLVDYLTAQFVRDGGSNLWHVWNTLTTWSSHPAGVKNKGQVVADREKRVSTLVQGRDWQELEAA